MQEWPVLALPPGQAVNDHASKVVSLLYPGWWRGAMIQDLDQSPYVERNQPSKAALMAVRVPHTPGKLGIQDSAFGI